MPRKLLAEAECSITLGNDDLLGAESKTFYWGQSKQKLAHGQMPLQASSRRELHAFCALKLALKSTFGVLSFANFVMCFLPIVF